MEDALIVFGGRQGMEEGGGAGGTVAKKVECGYKKTMQESLS